MKALVTARLSLEAEKAIATWFDCIQYAGWRETRERLSTQELVAALRDADVLVTEFDVVTKDVLVAARQLRVLACCRGEPEANVDTSPFRARSHRHLSSRVHLWPHTQLGEAYIQDRLSAQEDRAVDG